MAVPLLVGDRLIGMLTLDSFEADFYTAEHARMAEAFAAFAATAIDKARYVAELQRAREEAEAATRGEERFPRDDEPRDPDADERRHRHDRPAARHRADGGAAEFAEVVRSAATRCSTSSTTSSTIPRSRRACSSWNGAVRSRDCVEGALDIVAPRAAEKDVELGCLVDDGRAGGVVGDAARLRQVLLNLLSNAVKFTERARSIVHVDARPAGPARYRVHLAVRDTGIGIPQDRMDRLFESFTQADASTPPLRRHRSGSRDLEAPRRADGRHIWARAPREGARRSASIWSPPRRRSLRAPASTRPFRDSPRSGSSSSTTAPRIGRS